MLDKDEEEIVPDITIEELIDYVRSSIDRYIEQKYLPQVNVLINEEQTKITLSCETPDFLHERTFSVEDVTKAFENRNKDLCEDDLLDYFRHIIRYTRFPPVKRLFLIADLSGKTHLEYIGGYEPDIDEIREFCIQNLDEYPDYKYLENLEYKVFPRYYHQGMSGAQDFVWRVFRPAENEIVISDLSIHISMSDKFNEDIEVNDFHELCLLVYLLDKDFKDNRGVVPLEVSWNKIKEYLASCYYDESEISEFSEKKSLSEEE